MRQHGIPAYRGILVSIAALAALSISASAQTTNLSPWANPGTAGGVSVGLIQQDQSDCTNTTVKDDPNRTRGGEIWVTRGSDGNTTVNVAMTVTPNTTYNFYLKCVRQLGTIQTGDEGIGMATFIFATSSVGSTFAFDMYPDGAPSGNKFQSVTVKMP
jgi:hypothetical protein